MTLANREWYGGHGTSGGGMISGSGIVSLCFLMAALIACLTTTPWGVSAQNTVDASMATLCSGGVPSTEKTPQKSVKEFTDFPKKD